MDARKGNIYEILNGNKQFSDSGLSEILQLGYRSV